MTQTNRAIKSPGFHHALFLSASICALSTVAPNVVMAQTIPAECADTDGDGVAEDGETILCVSSTTVDGIYTNADDITITIGDASTYTYVLAASGDGINMTGAGALTLNIINSGSGVYGFANAIDIDQTDSAGSVTIYSEGFIYGNENGIVAKSAGDLSITTADVRARKFRGIYASASGGSLTINSAAGAVYGYQEGIVANNYGSGALSITTADVTGKTGDGIDVYNSSAGTDLTINSVAGAVYGYDDGIAVKNYGTGALTITTADVTGEHDTGIAVTNGGTATDLTINSVAGAVDGGAYGIFAYHEGSGALTITTANVTGAADDGIYAYNSVGTDMTVNSVAGAVFGYDDGIFANNKGSGALAITTADVTGYGGYGIDADNSANGTHLTINSVAGAVSGGEHGIVADNYGSGAVTITTADVTGADGVGIGGYNSTWGTDLTINSAAGAVNGGDYGIFAYHNGSGALTITTADVTGSADDGIYAYTSSSGKDLTINSAAGAVKGADYGIFARNYGSGALTITTADVTAVAFAGIYAYNSAGTNLTINSVAGAVIGYDGGIKADNRGSGALTITTADVTSQDGDGIVANNSSSGTDLIINSVAGAVSGYGRGIVADNDGGGVLTITTADVTGENYDGIRADNAASGTDLIINSAAGAVNGAHSGIYARNAGSGALTITTADVTGNARDGIYAHNAGTDLTINSAAGAVQSRSEGVIARNYGSGAVTIITADVTSGDDDGINAYNSNSGTDLIINSAAGAISGSGVGSDGVRARNSGSGALTITTADVTGKKGDGIDARNAANGTDLTINSAAGAVDGYYYGIYALNNGSGAVSITTADVTGGDYDGIYVRNSGTDLTVNSIAGHVDADYAGIEALNYGSGAVTITTASVNGYRRQGIYAYNSNSGTDVTINSAGGHVATGSIYYHYAGIGVRNYGSGAVAITTADVTSAYDDGIEVGNSSAGTDVTINSAAGTVYGADDGIVVFNYGAGAISIATADVTANDQAIYANGSGTDVTINSAAGSVYGGKIGVKAVNYGSGDLSITTGDVRGGESGVNARHVGGGVTSITVNGAVYGTTYHGIYAYGPNGVAITLNAGASVSGALSAINIAGASDDALTLEDGSTLSGEALLNDGDDVLNINGGDYAVIFGGDGTDSVNFAGAGGEIDNSGAANDGLQDFEILNFNAGGYDLTGDHVGWSQTSFNAGVNSLSGALTSTNVYVAAGATLNARDGSMITGALSNDGTLDVGDSPGTLTIVGDLLLGDTSLLPIEISDTQSDLIIVSGAVTLGGEIDVILLGGATFGSSTLTIIEAAGGFSGSVDVTSDGLLIANSVTVDGSGSGLTLTTTITAPASIDGLSANQQNIGTHLIHALTGDIDDPNLAALINAVGGISDEDALGAALEDLQPEPLDMGLKLMTATQDHFVDLTQSFAGNGLGPRASGAVARNGDATAWGVSQVFGVGQSGGDGHIDFDGNAYIFALGVSGIDLGPVRVGAAIGYSDFIAGADDAFNGAARGDSADGSALHLAADIQADLSPSWAFGLHGDVLTTLAYATGENDLEMYLTDPVSGAGVTQWTEVSVASFDWRTRLTVDGVGDQDWPVSPHIEVGLSKYHQDALTITGPDIVPLEVDELDNLRAQLGLGVSYEHRFADNLLMRADIAGVQYFGATANEFTSRFVGAPAEANSFLASGKDINRQVELNAVFDYRHDSGFVISAGAHGAAGDLNVIGGSLRLSKQF